ncbi:hypothetical protein [Arenimonas alkanexedens]
MTILRQLMIVEASALLALLAVAGAMAAYGAADSVLHSNAILDPAASAKLGFGYTAIIGLLPAVLYGAPGYVGLLRHNRARWPYVLMLGVLPGVLLLPFELSLGFFAVLCGAAVSLVTHFLCRRLRPNQSFKPTPSARLN